VIDALPYFLVVFRELGHLGIGVNRGRFQIASVEIVDPVSEKRERIYSAEDNLVRSTRMDLGLAQIMERIRDMKTDCVTLQFISPTKLIFQEREVNEPQFHHMFKRLRDRLSSLLYFYCGAESNVEQRELFALLGELSEKVEVTSSSLHRHENFRLTRRKEHHPLSGFTGTISFSGDLRPFLPLLVAGEWISVGKNTVFGNGWYRMR
jgi:hypothetical protein